MADPIVEEPVVDATEVVEEPVVETPSEDVVDFETMSDEDFMEKSAEVDIPALEEEEAPVEEKPEGEPVVEPSGDKPAEPVVETPAAVEEVVADPAPAVETPAPTAEAEVPSLTPEQISESYNKIMAPFKANGRDIQVRSPDEAIKLMQMGANYTRKMTEIKPVMQMVKTLENNKIDNMDDLNLLIEAKNGNPSAIKKLVRDSGINPLDIEVGDAVKDEDKNYRPQDHSASETQVDFDFVLTELSSIPTGQELLESVRTDWDSKSRAMIYNDPGILTTLNEHKQHGVYQMVDDQVAHERMLGKLKNVPYLDAYYRVAASMDKSGAFEVLENTIPANTNSNAPQSPAPATPAVAAPAPVVLATQAAIPASADNAAAKAASTIRTSTATKAPTGNILAMSDEDFLKSEQLAGIV